MIIIDTNVFSELMKPQADPSVQLWLASISIEDLYTTAITRAEVYYGIARLPDGKRKTLLKTSADSFFGSQFRLVLPFDGTAADYYADIVERRTSSGTQIGILDAQIAAIARCRKASVATRNTKDFADCGITVINPWDTSSL